MPIILKMISIAACTIQLTIKHIRQSLITTSISLYFLGLGSHAIGSVCPKNITTMQIDTKSFTKNMQLRSHLQNVDRSIPNRHGPIIG